MSNRPVQDHSTAWIVQTWLSFILSTFMTGIGVWYLPTNAWAKGYMAMGLVFTIGSTISLTKTQRDLHEGTKIIAKIEEAKMERILSEHHPLV